jgi:hypothetical protein
MPDGHHELRSGEDVYLTELLRLGLIDVASRAQNEKKRLAIALELGTLVGMHRILDYERVQIELSRERGELLLVGPIQPDPGDTDASTRGVQRRHRAGRSRAPAVAIDRAIYDHGASRSLDIADITRPRPQAGRRAG